MASFNKKISLKVAEQFPEFVQGDNAGVITFIEKYYEFLESAEMVLENLGLVDQILLEEGTSNFILLQNEDIRTEGARETNRIMAEDSLNSVFVKGETVRGSTSKATAIIRTEDINDNSRLFISSQNDFIIGEDIEGLTSGASGSLKSYRANPVENISQLMEYADIDNTVDSFFDQFKKEFLKTIPKSLASGVNKKNLLKNIKDLYRSKGTRKAHELFFRLLLNENIEVYYPTIDMLRVSDGNWSDETILRVVSENDVLLIEDDIDDNLFFINEDGSQIELEESSLSTSDIRKLVGQTITQAAVRDVQTELGGRHHPDTAGYQGPTGGYSAIGIATARVEKVTQFQLGSVVVNELTLADNSLTGTFIEGQNITGESNADSDIIITAKTASIVITGAITTSGQYYDLTDPIAVTSIAGTNCQIKIDTLTAGTISEIVVDTVGANYEIGDAVTVTNTDTGGTGLVAEVSVVNGGIAPETGSLIEQFRFATEAGTAGYPGELLTEDTTTTYFNQEEDYEMAATDHFILEDSTISTDSLEGNKVVQEIGSGTGDITDVRIKGVGENYTNLPTLALPTAGSRTGGKVIAKGTDVGKIAALSVTEPGIDYTTTVTTTPQQNFLVTGVSGTFTGGETITGGTSGKTATFVNLNTSTNVLKVSSASGTFTVGETLTGGLSSVTATLHSYDVSAISAGIGTSVARSGYFVNQDGFLSELSKKVQDSYYYQDYSYVIKSGTALALWKNDVTASIHPAGWEIFGRVHTVNTLNARIKSTASAPQELVDMRATYTPDLFSTLVTIFTTKVGRRLGGVSQTLSNAALIGVTGNTALNAAKDVSLTLTLTTGPIIWSSLSDVLGYAGAGVRVGNVVKYGFGNIPSSVGRIELELATTGSVDDFIIIEAGLATPVLPTDYNWTRDYLLGDGFQHFRGHEGYYETRDKTTLNDGGTLNSSDTSITLTDASKFGTQGIIVIENEKISYTGKSSHTLTGCTRGFDIQGTTDAASHADGSTVFNLKFVHTNAHGYRIQDVGSAVIGDSINNPQKRYHVPVPSEITLSYT